MSKQQKHSRAVLALMIAAALPGGAAYPMIAAEMPTGNITIEAACEIQAVQTDEAGKRKPTPIAIKAYGGGELRVKGYPYPVYVDVNGVSGMDRSVPVIRDHDKTRIVGTSQANKVGNEIHAAGVLVGKSADRAEVEDLAADGFEWQASIGTQPLQVEAVKAGQSAEVNGNTIQGPAYIARKSRLAEITICTVGADVSSHVSVAAELDDMGDGQGDPNSPSTPGVLEDIKRERARRAAIEATAVRVINAGGDIDAIEKQMQEAINGQMSSTEFELQLLRGNRTSTRIVTGASRELQGGMLEGAVEASLLSHLGWETAKLEANFAEPVLNAMDKHNVLKHGLSLQDALLFAGRQNGAGDVSRRDVQAMLRGAFGAIEASGQSTFSLTGILSNVANKVVRVAFMNVADLMGPSGEKLQAFAVLGAVGSVSDFKQRTSYSLTGDLQYQQVQPGGEIKHGSLGEQAYTNQADTYGRLLGLDRRDIINDDLGAFNAAGLRLGRGAALKLSDVFWTAYLDNADFFKVANNNYLTGAGSEFSLTALTAAEKAFIEQTDPDGKPLGLMPAIVLVPPGYSADASAVYTSTQIVSGNTSGKPANNPHAGKYKPYTSPYLSNSTYSGYSAKKWYLQGDPLDMAIIETVFLNGKRQPTVEQTEADFKQLGIQMRGYHDFGVSKQEPRAGVASKGES